MDLVRQTGGRPVEGQMVMVGGGRRGRERSWDESEIAEDERWGAFVDKATKGGAMR